MDVVEHEKPVLPPDIIEFIVSKLPVKSLLQFKRVSKSWYTLISDPIFVRNHLHLAMYSNSHNLFLPKISLGYHGFFSLIKFQDRKFTTVRKIKSPDSWNTILCVCNGAFLLTNFWYTNFVLWNPLNRTEKRFLLPYEFRFRLGYGVCPDIDDINDFKVVIISTYHYLIFWTKANGSFRTIVFDDDHIGPLKSGSQLMNRSGVCADGVAYWVMHDDNGIKIVYFDPSDDEFKILGKPENLEDSNNKLFSLTIWSGFLCLYCNGADETTVEIWIKEKGRDNSTWMKLITVENVTAPISCFKPQCLVDNKILFLSQRSISLYDPCEKTYEKVEDNDLCSVDVLVPYMDGFGE